MGNMPSKLYVVDQMSTGYMFVFSSKKKVFDFLTDQQADRPLFIHSYINFSNLLIYNPTLSTESKHGSYLIRTVVPNSSTPAADLSF